MAIYEERVSHVPRNNRGIIDIDVIDIVDDIDALALAGVSGFNYPDILFGIILFNFLIMGIKIPEFIWKNVGVRYKVKGGLTKLFLHSNNVEA